MAKKRKDGCHLKDCAPCNYGRELLAHPINKDNDIAAMLNSMSAVHLYRFHCKWYIENCEGA